MTNTENNTSSPFDFFENEKEKLVWKKSYTWVLLANALYILIFYFIMKIFN